METTTKPRDRNVNLRLTDHAHALLAAMRESTGLKNTGLVELAIREKAERDGVRVAEDRKD